jgi:hypothetical protein
VAQVVGYFEDGFEDGTKYVEGPFVMVEANGWRVEAEVVGNKCPCLPDVSIYRALEKETTFSPHKTNDIELAKARTDWLNRQVREGKIVLNGKIWVYPKHPW